MALKKIKISLFFIIAIFLVLSLSVSFQSLLAAWTAPLANPPTCATGDPGCDAPLNAGPLIQPKSGALWLNTNGLSPYGLIVESGNVGIGTTGPLSKLDVNGHIRTSGGPTFHTGWGVGTSGWETRPNDAGNTYGFNNHYGISFTAHSYYGGIRFYNQGSNTGTYPYLSDATMVMAITDGNVGIGTTNPYRGKLHIYNSGTYNSEYANGFAIESADDDVILQMGADTTNNMGYIQVMQPGVSWGTRALTLQPNAGNVGIGTTGPSSGLKLDVEGKVGATEYCDQNGSNCTTPTALSIKCDWTGWRYTGITKVYNNNLPYNCFDMYCNGSVVTQVKANKCYDHFF